MSTMQPLSDELIRAAMARRASRGVAGDLHVRVLRATAGVSQRRRWISGAGWTLVGGDRRRVMLALAAVALLVVTSLAVALVGSRLLEADGRGGGLVFISGGDLWVAHADGTDPRLVWAMSGAQVASRPTWVDSNTVLVQELNGGVYAVDLRSSLP